VLRTERRYLSIQLSLVSDLYHVRTPPLRLYYRQRGPIWKGLLFAKFDRLTRNADLLRSLVASQGDHPCQAEHDPDGLRAARWRPERPERPYKEEPRSGRGLRLTE